jgi:hypothetical protein
MRPLLSLVRASNCSACLRPAFFGAPPRPVHPTWTATARNFTTTPSRFKFKVPQRKKQEVKMSHAMTTKTGEPFDRASLESVMKVVTLYDGYAPFQE